MSILVERAKHALYFRNDYQLGL